MKTEAVSSPNPLRTPVEGDHATTGAGQNQTPSTTGNAPMRLAVDRLLQELGGLATQLQLQTKKGGDGVSNANGAPALAPPATTFSADDLATLITSMRAKTQDAQLKTAGQALNTANINAQKNNEAQLAKIDEWIRKSAEAKSSGTWGKIFGWAGKILAVVAAVAALAATIATAGAATPLLVMTTAAAIGATMSLADQVSQELGGPKISIGNLITSVVAGVLEAAGVPHDKAQSIGKTVAGLVGVGLAIAFPAALLAEPSLLTDLAEGICELAGASDEVKLGVTVAVSLVVTIGVICATLGAGAASSATSAVNHASKGTQMIEMTSLAVDKGAKVASTAAKAADTTTKVADTTAKVADAATKTADSVSRTAQVATTMRNTSRLSQVAADAGQSASGMVKASFEKDANLASSQRVELAAVMVKLQQQMEEGREDIKKVLQQIEDGIALALRMLDDANASLTQISANMKGRSTV